MSGEGAPVAAPRVRRRQGLDPGSNGPGRRGFSAAPRSPIVNVPYICPSGELRPGAGERGS